MQYRFTVPLWVWAGENPWYFVTVPEDESDDIDMRAVTSKRGFGSVKVRVTVGSTTWLTSVFPDSKRQAYVLPIKKQVRTAESLTVDGPVNVVLELVDAP